MRLTKPYLILVFGILATSQVVLGQKRSTSPEKDSVQISCILFNAKQSEPEKASVDYGTTELKLILSSPGDTVVKAPVDAVVSTIQREQDGTWEIVFYHNDYWFWLSGLTKVSVRKNGAIKTGQVIGMVEPGKKLELLMFDFETPVDPRNYYKCAK